MIDNIRFNFTITPSNTKAYIDSIEKEMTLTKIYKNGKVHAYRGKLYLKKGITEVTKTDGKVSRKLPHLRVTIFLLENKVVKISLMNSLRKWFSNDKVLYEFNNSDFQWCVTILAKKLNVAEKEILNAKVTQVEYGSNLKLKPQFRCFHLCIFSHRFIPTKEMYGAGTVKFCGTNKDVIFYDKTLEDRHRTKRYNAANTHEIMKRSLVLRYEISVTKVSGESFAKAHMSTINSIIVHWDYIAESWVRELDNIIFVNNMSGKIYSFLEDSQIKTMTDYLIYMGMENLGMDRFYTLLYERALPTKRSILTNKYVNIYKRMKDFVETENFEETLKKEVLKQAKLLLK